MTPDLPDDVVARLRREAERRGMSRDALVSEWAYQLPAALPEAGEVRRLGSFALGASTDGRSVKRELEHVDVRVSTLRDYLETIGARLELVAVFDDEERRVPVHLGKEPAA